MTDQDESLSDEQKQTYRRGLRAQMAGAITSTWGAAQCRGDTIDVVASRLGESTWTVKNWLDAPHSLTIEAMADLGLALRFYWAIGPQRESI